MNPLHVFAVASRHQTFTAAARELGVTQVAVSRQISVLEDYINTELFVRSARSVKLTETGQALSQEITPLFEDLNGVMRNLMTKEREQTIDLRVYPTLSYYWLLPKLKGFNSQYSDYTIRMDTLVKPLDFRGTKLDVAIQLGHGDWSNSKARKLFPAEIDMLCSPAYAQEFDLFDNPDNFRFTTLLQSRYRRRDWQDWIDNCKVNNVPKAEVEYKSSILTYGAVREGLGLAIGELNTLKAQIDQGVFVRPFNQSVEKDTAYWVVWPTFKSTAPKVKYFIDWLLRTCGQQPEFFK
ncbi:MAG: LysR family transcriptional regulator [Methylocystaceae bacterium]|nr:LysR family transcriptional regulator [Methylocystaceae bacterium]